MANVREYWSLKSLAVIGASCALVVGGTALVAAAPESAEPLRCKIAVHRFPSAVSLQGLVYANAASSGHYEFVVSKIGGGGTSDINQNGEFTVAPGQKQEVGVVTLGDDGGKYTATLKITAGGHAIECRQRVDGQI